jgi:sugar phosphate isomerase/epimerase
MAANNLAERLAVCSWSLQPTSPAELAARLQEAGATRTQLALDPLRENPAVWASTPEVLAARGIRIVSGMFGTVGEDYTTLDTIRVTGGVAPDVHWEANRNNAEATADLAQKLGLPLVTFHAGFLPHDATDPQYGRMIERLATIADLFASRKLRLGFETGQESAQDLARVLHQLNRPNICVNFDPANMILYGKGDPVEAVGVLGPWIGQVHIKDATRTRVPGTWGEEVPAGTGDVDWPAFFGALDQIRYRGDLVIEREAGTRRVEDIRTARELVNRLLSKQNEQLTSR